MLWPIGLSVEYILLPTVLPETSLFIRQQSSSKLCEQEKYSRHFFKPNQ